MSSREPTCGDTTELSDFEVLLTRAPSATVMSEPRSSSPDRLTRPISGDLGPIGKGLEELANQELTYKLKSR
jgi:hypothetical protein